MANKRELKKNIHRICGDIAAEILIASKVLKGFDSKQVAKIINEIAALQEQSLCNSSFSFDKTARDFDNVGDYRKARAKYYKAAYNQLEKDFRESVLAIVKDMNAAMPPEVKEANKTK